MHGWGYRRKKDHGRAEAILIASWGLGLQHPEARSILTLNLQPLLQQPTLAEGSRSEAADQEKTLAEGSVLEKTLEGVSASENLPAEASALEEILAANVSVLEASALEDGLEEACFREETLAKASFGKEPLSAASNSLETPGEGSSSGKTLGRPAEQTLAKQAGQGQLRSTEHVTGPCETVQPKRRGRKPTLGPQGKTLAKSSKPESTLAEVQQTLAVPARSKQTLGAPSGFFQTLAMSTGSNRALTTQAGSGEGTQTLGLVEADSPIAGKKGTQNPNTKMQSPPDCSAGSRHKP